MASCLILLSWITFARAETRVLAVGIDSYANTSVPDLKAGLPDVARFKAVLQACRVNPNLKTLTNRQATKEAVIRGFRSHLIDNAGPNDVVIFYYTGHGYFCPDRNGDESDGWDEALLTYDADPENDATWFTDDELGLLLSQVKSARTLVIIDSCHSGTATRAVGKPAYNGRKGVLFNFPLGKAPKEQPAKDSTRFVKSIQGKSEAFIFFAAQAYQEANEISPDEFRNALGVNERQYSGLFSHALFGMIARDPEIPVGDLRDGVNALTSSSLKRLRASHYDKVDQTPLWEIPNGSMRFGQYVRGE